MKRNVYLKKETLEDAFEILCSKFDFSDMVNTEVVTVPEAVGRVLAEPVTAQFSSPSFHASAMDGIAVKAENTFGANESNPRRLEISTDAFYVNTGHVIPDTADAVIMIENVNVIDDKSVEIETPAFPWQHIRKMGEDIVATELLFPRNHEITPYCVGALLSGGIFEVTVRQKPNLLIVPTGSELVDWKKNGAKNMKPGQVLESNSYVLGALTESCGGKFDKNDMVKDSMELIAKTVEDATKDNRYHMVLVVGGSSAGSEDYARAVIENIGEVLVHGVTIMPGKPVIIGVVNNKPVFGMPGYPVSTIVAYEQFVQPVIAMMLNKPVPEKNKVRVEPTRKIASKLGVEEFLRVKLGTVRDRVVATPLPRGAGCITTLTDADGIIRIPNHIEGLKDDDEVYADLLRPMSSIDNTIVAVGSHDNTVDVLADLIRWRHSNVTLSSSHVGSMGGLMAIKKGVCHIAGSHLLDVEDGTYNRSYINKYLSDVPVKLVNLVLRDQGLIVPKGNPKGVSGIGDLSGLTFINRQGGSGTRILFDYKLSQLGITSEEIKGYENEEFTHMNVAAAVLGGRVDAGLGIYAAAKALDLDFVPVVTEQYDFVIPEEYFETKNISILLETINSPEFKKQVNALGGYSLEKTGYIY